MDSRRGFLKKIGILGSALFVIPKVLLSPVKPIKPVDLGKRGFVNWKTHYRSAVLNSDWVGRVESIRLITP